MPGRSLWLGWFLLSFGAYLPAAGAQSHVTRGAVSGAVYDGEGTALVGVEVSATELETSVTRTARTDDQGRFFLPALEPGTYRIEAEVPSYVTQVLPSLRVELGSEVQVEFRLPASRFEEHVTVTASSSVVDIKKTETSTVIALRQINELPIKERDFIFFSLLTPGVTRDLALSSEGVAAASGLSFAGQRARSNNIMVDGFDNNDRNAGAARARFGQESIAEFQVLTNSFSAEFGNASGGVVNIITKDGTNDFAGNAFLFVRDESLSARNYFETFDPAGVALDRAKAPYQQKQWGFTFGGPISRGKSHFFGSFESGDTTASNFVNIDPIAAASLEAKGFPIELGSIAYDVDSTQVLAKWNHRFAPEHSIGLRANYSSVTNGNIEPFGGIVAGSRGAIQFREDWALAASLTNVFSTALLSETRLQLARQDQRVNSLDPACGGPCTDEFLGGPTVEITGVASVGRLRTTPQPRENFLFQLNQTLSYFTPSHSLKLGGDVNVLDGSGALPLHFGGRFIFAPLPAIPRLGVDRPLSALEAFVAGLPAAYVQGYGNSGIESMNGNLSLFVQDEWSVSSRLVLKMGLRYQSQFWSDFTFVTNGFAESFAFPSDNDDLAPRASFAYDLMGDGRTNLHGAYGLFYDSHISGVNSVPFIVDGAAGVRTFVAPLPLSVAAWRAPGRRLPEPELFPSLQFAADPGLRTPFAHHLSFGVEHAFTDRTSLLVGTVYVKGENQIGSIDYNPLVSALGAGRRPLDVSGVPGTSASVLQYTSFGETWYRGLLVSLRKRFGGRYQLLASYTLSKAEDTSTDFQSSFLPEDNGRGRVAPNDSGLPLGFNPNREKGPAINDQRHRLVVSGSYELPWNFSISGIVTADSGRPYNILAGADLNGDGDGGTFPSDRARVEPSDPSTSVRRNSGRLPPAATVDLRLAYDLKLGGRANAVFLVEAFNLLNRANFIDVNNIFGTGRYPEAELPNFGQYTRAAAPRQIQLAVKLSF